MSYFGTLVAEYSIPKVISHREMRIALSQENYLERISEIHEGLVSSEKKKELIEQLRLRLDCCKSIAEGRRESSCTFRDGVVFVSKEQKRKECEIEAVRLKDVLLELARM